MVSENPGQPDDSAAGAPDDSAAGAPDDSAAARSLCRRGPAGDRRRGETAAELGRPPISVERELDQLFLAHSPLGGRGAALRDMLRLVDASVFIDPVVPVGVASPRRRRRQAGPALAQPLVTALRHPPGERVRHGREPRPARARRAGDGPAPQGRGVGGGARRCGRGRLGPQPRRVVGADRHRRTGVVPRPGAARRVRRRVARHHARRRRGRRLRRRSPRAGAGARSSRIWTCASRTSSSTSTRWPRARSDGVVLSGVAEGSGYAERRRLLHETARGASPPAASCSSTPCPRRAGTRPTRRSKPTWRRPVPIAPPRGPASSATSASTPPSSKPADGRDYLVQGRLRGEE